MFRRPPRSPLFPSPPLSRPRRGRARTHRAARGCSRAAARAAGGPPARRGGRASILGGSGEHTSELQSQSKIVCRLLLGKKKKTIKLLKPIPTKQTAHTLT